MVGLPCISFLPFFTVMKMFQSYVDPELQTVGSGGPAVTTGEGDDVVLPLDDNILSCNLGVPVVVVCAKVRGSVCIRLQLNVCVRVCVFALGSTQLGPTAQLLVYLVFLVCV